MKSVHNNRSNFAVEENQPHLTPPASLALSYSMVLTPSKHPSKAAN
jgi:hypothetical protein